MMYVIKKTANENGSRPPLQIWTKQSVPNGYAICPDEFYDVFYRTSPAGFVNITVDNDIVTSMEVNQTALNEYRFTICAMNLIIHREKTVFIIWN